ncbi:universal stress protein [Pseudomonas synxantha]|uniref:Universal stress protein n=1 Tax=Pseudomonas synxantha TaxID=47883 RepID=A0ABS0URG9_9PSED|nr:universal stress protein [Pseudomonas synxantha]MBI6568201.1 universal stress protein [Pseudomonas synxantha]MBI6584506.1 universal stress protein [Pseudomonas synxantha]MBI6647209.1 universal stress protein [Pseudomonas synxantha]
MQKLKRILLIVPTEMTRTPAFDRAQALACATGALLHIVAFDYVEALAVAGLFDHDAMTRAREGYLQTHRHWLEQQARLAGTQVTCEVVWAKANPGHVLDYVNDFHADLVIKDTHHVPALERAFHQPLDWRLLRDCQAHLHLVTEARNPKPLKVLVAIDLSHLEELTQGVNEQVLDLASTLAASCGARLSLLSISNWSVVHDTSRSVPTLSLKDSLRDAVNDAQEEAFELLASRYGIDENRRHLLTGIPHAVIEQFARQNEFDILVLGATHVRGGDLFIGSTAERVFNHPPCSLLIVQP